MQDVRELTAQDLGFPGGWERVSDRDYATALAQLFNPLVCQCVPDLINLRRLAGATKHLYGWCSLVSDGFMHWHIRPNEEGLLTVYVRELGITLDRKVGEIPCSMSVTGRVHQFWMWHIEADDAS